MKKLVLCLSLLTLTGCAPFQVDFSLYERNTYTVPCDGTHSNAPGLTSDLSERSYGNNNHVTVNQSMVLWKSPTTNSSNSVPITLPLMGM